MRRISMPLMWKFLILFLCVMLFGVLIITISNLYILGWKWEDLLEYNMLVLLLEGCIGVFFLQVVTWAGLKNTRKLFKNSIRSEVHYYKAWNEMVNFPSRIFLGMACFGIAASLLYHTGERLYYHDQINIIYCVRIASVVLFEQTLSLILALLFFTGSRRLLRPYVLEIPGIFIHKFRKTTFYYHLLIIFSCLMIITLYTFLWYVLDAAFHAKSFSIRFLICLALFDMGFGIAIFRFFIRELRDDFNVLMEAMSSLLKGSRTQLKAKVPIVSNDEIGNLGLMFNTLQEKVSKEYDEIDAELQLACSIQQRLLPEGEKVFGPCTAIGFCKPCRDVGGDFFDIIPLENGKFTVIIGDVIGKGMPAALIMSAMLLLFRNEMRRGGTAPEVLTRLNEMVMGLGMNDIYVTLGIAVFDMRHKVMQYASAGHVAPYVLREHDVKQFACSSLPLGISLEESYEEIEYDMKAGDRFIFYTDGIIDAVNHPSISGFDAFEKILFSIEEDFPVSQQEDFIFKSIESKGSMEHKDDTTLLIVQYNRQ